MNGESVVLGLDLGTTAGWAAACAGEIASGTWFLGGPRGEAPGMRFLRFAKELERIHEETGGVDRVFYEKVMGHKSVLASHMYGGFEAVMLGFCANHGIPAGEIHVSTLKKYATGSGRADKETMTAMAIARGWDPETEDEADALWVLDWGLNR